MGSRSGPAGSLNTSPESIAFALSPPPTLCWVCHQGPCEVGQVSVPGSCRKMMGPPSPGNKVVRASCDWKIRQQLATGWKPVMLMSSPVASALAKPPFSRLPCGLNKHTRSTHPITLLLIERHHFVFILCDELIMKNFPEPVGKLGAQGVSLWPIPQYLEP